MDPYTLAEIMRGIGAERVSVAGDRVRCACVLARWTHPRGSDSHPSMVVFPEGKYGDPIYSCQGCHESGSVRDLVCDLWSLTKVDLYPWIEAIDKDAKDVSEAIAKTRRERAAKLAERADSSFVARPDYAKKALAKKAGRKFEPQQGASAFYDYVAANASDQMDEIPWEEYEPYAGSVPRYAIQDRLLTVETCKAWELGHDRRMKRLLFPMRDRQGRLVAISGRLYACPGCGLEPAETVSPSACTACGHVDYDIDPDDGCSTCGHSEMKRQRGVCARCHRRAPPKYLHSKGFKRNLLLFGEHRGKVDRTDGRVYVVEGHIDVLTLWQVGYRPVVATLGSHPGATQVEKLIRDHERIVIVGDGDEAGEKFAVKLKQAVAQRLPVGRKKLPSGTDPNRLLQTGGDEALREVLGRPPVDVDATVVTR